VGVSPSGYQASWYAPELILLIIFYINLTQNVVERSRNKDQPWHSYPGPYKKLKKLWLGLGLGSVLGAANLLL
jgi:hypothetical protein